MEASFLGRGSYGSVYRLDRTHALKKIIGYDRFEVPGLQEIAALTNIQSNHVIPLSSVHFVEKNEIITAGLVLPLYNGDIIGMINNDDLDTLTRKEIAYQIVQGVADMHRRGWLHRDLKPANILFKFNPLNLPPVGIKVVIADLGMAKKVELGCSDCNYIVVTLAFRAPELLLQTTNYSYPIDIWSLGLIILYLLTGINIHEAKNSIEQLQVYFQIFGLPTGDELITFEKYPAKGILAMALANPEFLSYELLNSMFLNPLLTDEVLEVVTRICQYIPEKRPNAEEILAFKFFDDVRLLSEPLTLNYKFYLTQALLQESSQSSINIATDIDRAAILDWLFHITEELLLQPLIYQQAIYLIDRYSQVFPPDKDYQKTVLAALYIIAKISSEDEYDIGMFYRVSKRRFSAQVISSEVRKIVMTLKGHIIFVTPANLIPLLFPELDEKALLLVNVLLVSSHKFSAEQISYGVAYILSDNKSKIVYTSRYMWGDLDAVVHALHESFKLTDELEYYPQNDLYKKVRYWLDSI